MWLSKHLNSSLLTRDNLIARQFPHVAFEASKHYQRIKVGLAPGTGMGTD
jgi:hypothetical protein